MDTKFLEMLEELWISSTRKFIFENQDSEDSEKEKPIDPPKKIKAFTD